MPLSFEKNLVDWVALSLVSGVGSRTAAALIDRFGSPTACFEAGPAALAEAGLKREQVEAISSSETREEAARQIDETERRGGQILTLHDARYPALLKEIYDPPIVIYAKGDLGRALEQPPIAVVGSRHCSTYGRNVAEMLSRDLGERGVTIVSGLARGIDSAAHQGALDGGGITVAVMATGLDAVYPKENRKLAEQIAERGALITEFCEQTPPLSQNFPFRNRIISGISRGVLVVEAAERSGSLITARMAYEQGRDVFAVPGNITSSKSFGPNFLIKDGAKLVHTWRDVVEEFPIEIKRGILSAERAALEQKQYEMDEVTLSENERQILSRLRPDEPTHIDSLITRSRLQPGEMMGALLRLEMLDRIKQLPGKSFVRKL
jgi:DNA processing protein